MKPYWRHPNAIAGLVLFVLAMCLTIFNYEDGEKIQNKPQTQSTPNDRIKPRLKPVRKETEKKEEVFTIETRVSMHNFDPTKG